MTMMTRRTLLLLLIRPVMSGSVVADAWTEAKPNIVNQLILSLFLSFLCSAPILLAADGEEASGKPRQPMTLKEIIRPYAGPVEKGVDNTTLYNMCGYQGWFAHKLDGYTGENMHWAGGGGDIDQNPPRCSVDLWPDLSECDPDELFPTNYKYADGSPAYVFSSTQKKTVVRHFKWMQEHGIHGVFKQRFGSTFTTDGVFSRDAVKYASGLAALSHCREGANRYGRVYAVMYDVSFHKKMVDAIIKDWTVLYNEMGITKTPAYARHRGGPVVSLWGYGFGHRKVDPAAAERLFKFLKDPKNGGCTIMLGVNNDWGKMKGAKLELLKKYATIVSPWTPGRYRTPDEATTFFDRWMLHDLPICEKYKLDYYPVAFPGFSWANLKYKQNAKLNVIPRLGGKLFWSQVEAVRKHKVNMLYVAMFDEVDEGTAMFKCLNNPPMGRFATYEGYPSDHYLRLTGLAGKAIAGEDVAFPEVQPVPVTYKPMTKEEYDDPERR